MNYRCIPLLLAVLLHGASAAAADGRIRREPYSPDRVVDIFTGIGVPTLIQFEEGEEVVNTKKGMIGMGDAKAWSVGPRSNNIMLKPLRRQPDTPLLVVTNRRTYAFSLRRIPKNSQIQPTYIVRFSYPDARGAAGTSPSPKQELARQRLAQVAGTVLSAPRNALYDKRGNEDLAPSQAFDDGRFTYLRFDRVRNLPVVTKLLPDGSPAQVNFHMEPDTRTMVLHEVARDFVLEYGDAVMELRNNGFSAKGTVNPLGTTVPATVRLTKEAQ